MPDFVKTAYVRGEQAALEAFGFQKQAVGPLAPLIGTGARMLATRALPWIGRQLAGQIPGAVANTGAQMAINHFSQPSAPKPPAPLPGMMGQGPLPGFVG